MTNRQWLLEQMQNMSDADFVEAFESGTYLCELQGCGVKRNINCEDCVEHWLNEEHKEIPKLSDAERVILENLPKIYGYITRDANGNLFIYQTPPVKIDKRWFCNLTSVHISPFVMFNDLFQFIKWEDEQAHNIQELLEG